MKWKNMKKSNADNIMQTWGGKPEIDCDMEYADIRSDLISAYSETLKQLNNNKIQGHEYSFDIALGMKLYDILSVKNHFSVRDASNDGIWRYISIKVVPDIVFARWGINPSRFWRESRRIWLKTLWWYIYLSWQGSVEETLMILRDNTTDQIVQLVERPGSNGYRVELYRQIMQYYGNLPAEMKKGNLLMFRRVMKLNTARLRVVEPALLQGGEKQYVKELFGYFDL
jgi:hypothetical protein